MSRLQFAGLIADQIQVGAAYDSVNIEAVAASGLDHLSNGRLAIIVKTSRLDESLHAKKELAKAIVDAFAEKVRQRFGLAVRSELDRPQRCDIPEGATRTLLPHHDGGHCSFLTAPRSASFTPQRTIRNEAYCTTDAHKIYQGLFLEESGGGLSLTSYFDLVRIIFDAWTYREGARPTISQLMDWYSSNLNDVIERDDNCGYLPIGAQIGAKGPCARIPIHSLEAVHEVEHRADTATCLVNQVTESALGQTFERFMENYALLAQTETGDLLLGHNLFALHGGVEGGRGREIRPMCITTAPEGMPYENWLSFHWQAFFDLCAVHDRRSQ